METGKGLYQIEKFLENANLLNRLTVTCKAASRCLRVVMSNSHRKKRCDVFVSVIQKLRILEKF